MKKRFLDIVPYICERWAEVVEKDPSAPFIEVKKIPPHLLSRWRSRPLGYLMRYLTPRRSRPLGYLMMSRSLGYLMRSRPLGYLMRSRPLGYLSPGMGRPLGYVLRGRKWTICLPVSTHGCRDMESVRKILS